MKTHTKTLLTALTASAMLAGSTQAAVITWSVKESPTDTDVSTTGTLVEAANFGGAEVDVNGVTFDAASFISGPYPLSNLAGLSFDSHTTTAYSSGGSIDSIMQSVAFDSPPQTVQLTGLTVDNTYVVQIFMKLTAGRTMTYSDEETGGNSVVVNQSPGAIITGTFTADDVTQTMKWTESVGSAVGNGYQLRVVPEPGSLALLGLGGLLIASRRRRG